MANHRWKAVMLTKTLVTRTRTRTYSARTGTRTRTLVTRTRIRTRTLVSRTRTRTLVARTRTRTRTLVSRSKPVILTLILDLLLLLILSLLCHMAAQTKIRLYTPDRTWETKYKIHTIIIKIWMVSMSQYLRCLKTYSWTVTVTQDCISASRGFPKVHHSFSHDVVSWWSQTHAQLVPK